MTIYYADASARVKHYVQEPGSDRVRTICTPGAGHMVAVAQIGLVEVAAAFGLCWCVLCSSSAQEASS